MQRLHQISKVHLLEILFNNDAWLPEKGKTSAYRKVCHYVKSYHSVNDRKQNFLSQPTNLVIEGALVWGCVTCSSA